MLESRRRSFAEKVPVPPLKKVTFYGPVTNKKGDQLRHMENQTASSKRTLFSASQSSRSKHDIDFNSTEHLRPQKNEERPHSKTPVLGKQMKTRMNCNHTKPKCEACITNQKKVEKHKHKSLISDIPRHSHILSSSRHSHVLPSTRSHPRGGTDGRKLYDQNEENNPLSILDATWKPGADASYERVNGIDDSNSYWNGSRQAMEEGTRKKVQFADGLASKEGRALLNHSKPSNLEEKQDSVRQNFQRRDNFLFNAELESSKPKGVYNAQERHRYSSSRPEDDDYDSSSTDQDARRLGDEDTCRICESLKRRCSKHSKDNPLSGSKRDQHPSNRHHSHALPISTSSSDVEEHCVLCQRYGKKHYYVDDSDSCGLCEVPYRNLHRVPCLPPKVSKSPERCSHHRPIIKSPVHRQRSAPLFFSDGEEEHLLKRKIPYEPKTDIVKDLKKKLEDDYLHKEYLRKRRNFHRRWRSWDAEDLEDLRNFRRHRCDSLPEYIPHHKCIHRYLQNNRLFLEPTLTDEDGSSLCSECGAPKPDDHFKDPYLYHITLGGLRNQDKLAKGSVNLTHRDPLSSKNRSHRSNYSTERPPREMSKHAFAKFNHNVSNIFPVNSHHHHRPRLADELRYRVNPHSRRHPSRSMALVDHLL